MSAAPASSPVIFQPSGSDGTHTSEWPAIVEAHPTSFKIEVKLNQEIFLDMELTNTTQSLVSFKVKTTTRDRYLLRPTQDYIPPGSSKSCKIVMARMSEYPDLSNPKNAKDKFLVQSCIVKEPVADLSKMWKDLESIHAPKQNRFAYHEQRVKCKLSLPKQKDHKEKGDKHTDSKTTSTVSAEPVAPISTPSSTRSTAPGPTSPTHTTSTSTNITNFTQQPQQQAITTPTPTTITPSISAGPSASTTVRDVDDEDEGGMISSRGRENETVTALRSQLERKQRELDELMDFVVKLTAHNERLKAETTGLQQTNKKLTDQTTTYQTRIQTLQEQIQQRDREEQERPTTPSTIPLPAIHAEPGEGETTLRHRRDIGESENVTVESRVAPQRNSLQLVLVVVVGFIAFIAGRVFGK